MRTRHDRLFLTTLTLAGLAGCDATPASEPAAQPRNGFEVLEPFADDCLTDTKLVLNHDDGTIDVVKDIGAGLAELARPRDVVELTFAISDTCLTEHGPRVTLAASTLGGEIAEGTKPAAPTRAYDVATARFKPDGGTLTVRLPDCGFQVDLAHGEPLATQAPGSDYAAEGRLIVKASGGDASCVGVPKLGVRQFDSVQPGWGEAPVTANFGWELAADDAAAELRCELDLDADGAVDHVLDPCPRDTSGFKVAALPEHVYAALGKHRPELTVSDGKRRVWAATTIYANHLEYRDEVRFVEDTPAFIGGSVVAGADGEPTVVGLKYASTTDVPLVVPGDIVVGKAGDGYMLRVLEAKHALEKLEVVGTPVGLPDAVAGGFLGLRDVAIETSDARCVGTCEAPIEPVEAPPSAGAPGVALALDAPAKLAGGEARHGVRIAKALPNDTKIELYAGIVVKDFVFDLGFFSIDAVDVQVTPTVEVTVSSKAASNSLGMDFGRYVLGVLPTPLPVTIFLVPRADLEATLKFAIKGKLEAPAVLQKFGDDWSSHLDAVASGDAELSDGAEVAGEVKLTALLKTEFALGLLSGPYVGPYVALAGKAAADEQCNFCLSAALEGGTQLGWSKPWGNGDLFEPIKFFKKFDLFKECWPTGLPDEICEPTDPPGGPGGTWGDVHVVSHDGLLFDFQSGGEFVLVRATGGAPFEVQTRQEPLADNYNLSINTAVATRVDGHTVGFYARRPALLYVDGLPRTLEPGASAPLGAGSVARVGDRYTLSFPSGETVTVRPVAATDPLASNLDVTVTLPPGRQGQVEGLLGDADGEPSDDILLADGQHLVQPVAFDAFYRGPDSFAEAWRVDPAASLFLYDQGQSAQTFAAPPYTLMPYAAPGPDLPYQAAADEHCGDCRPSLRESCVLDVGNTGDPAYAAACQSDARLPAEEAVIGDAPVIVSPRDGAAYDCDTNAIVFRAPGAGSTTGYPAVHNFSIRIDAYRESDDPDYPTGWYEFQSFDTRIQTIPQYPWRLDCAPIGNGTWGECKFYPDNEVGVCNPGNVFDVTDLRVEVRSYQGEERIDRAFFAKPEAP